MNGIIWQVGGRKIKVSGNLEKGNIILQIARNRDDRNIRGVGVSTHLSVFPEALPKHPICALTEDV